MSVWHGKSQPRSGPFKIEAGGGLDVSLPGHRIQKDRLQICSNMFYDGYNILPRTREGLGAGVLLTPEAPNTVNGIFRYVKDASTSFIVYATNGTLKYVSGTSGVTIGSLPNTNPPQMVNMNGVLVIACGSGANLRKWDGQTGAGPGTPASATISIGQNNANTQAAQGTITVYGVPARRTRLVLSIEERFSMTPDPDAKDAKRFLPKLRKYLLNNTDFDPTAVDNYFRKLRRKLKEEGVVTVRYKERFIFGHNAATHSSPGPGKTQRWEIARDDSTTSVAWDNQATAIAAALNADSRLVAASASGAAVTVTANKLGQAFGIDWHHTCGSAIGINGDYVGETTAAYGSPNQGDTIQIGSMLYMFVNNRGQQGEVTIGNTNYETCANLAGAIETDQWDVKVATDGSSNSPNHAYLVLESTSWGTAGNGLKLAKEGQNISLQISSGSVPTHTPDFTTASATFSGGTEGIGLQTIDTYGAPTPDVLHHYMGRIWAADSSGAERHRVYASSPFTEMDWNSRYGYGEYLDIGRGDGNSVIGIGHFKQDLVIHKGGRNPELYRLFVPNWSPESWQQYPKMYENVSVAAGKNSTVGVGNKHIFLSQKTLESIVGSDQYDELVSDAPGERVQKLISANTSAFIAAHPNHKCLYIFPRADDFGIIYNFVQDKFSTMTIANGVGALCATYDESDKSMYWGGDDGQIYKMDGSSYVDGTTPYSGRLRSAFFGSEDMADHYVKQTIIDFEHLATGSCTVSAVVKKETPTTKPITTFNINTPSAAIYNNTDAIFNNTDPIYAESHNRVNDDQIASGKDFALDVVVNAGGLAIESITMMLAEVGRDMKE